MGHPVCFISQYAENGGKLCLFHNPLSSFRLDVRAMPFPRTTASSGDDSFNTERLDEQNSAENIRSSMQKYLQVRMITPFLFHNTNRPIWL